MKTCRRDANITCKISAHTHRCVSMCTNQTFSLVHHFSSWVILTFYDTLLLLRFWEIKSHKSGWDGYQVKKHKHPAAFQNTWFLHESFETFVFSITERKQKLAAWNGYFTNCIRDLHVGILAGWPHVIYTKKDTPDDAQTLRLIYIMRPFFVWVMQVCAHPQSKAMNMILLTHTEQRFSIQIGGNSQIICVCWNALMEKSCSQTLSWGCWRIPATRVFSLGGGSSC